MFNVHVVLWTEMKMYIYIFVYGYSTTMVHGTSMCTWPSKILVLWYMGTRLNHIQSIGTEKMQSVLDGHRKKNIFSFLATVLLWCMGLGKNSIGTRPPTKKKYFVSFCLKINIFIHQYIYFLNGQEYVYWTMNKFCAWVWANRFPACRITRLKEYPNGSASAAWDYAGLLCNLYQDAGPKRC